MLPSRPGSASGTDADLKALVDWLATQKKAVENPPAE